jgi:hypothetical protein
MLIFIGSTIETTGLKTSKQLSVLGKEAEIWHPETEKQEPHTFAEGLTRVR